MNKMNENPLMQSYLQQKCVGFKPPDMTLILGEQTSTLGVHFQRRLHLHFTNGGLASFVGYPVGSGQFELILAFPQDVEGRYSTHTKDLIKLMLC